MNKTIKHSIKGRVGWKVVRGGNVIQSGGPYNNMILSSGLDLVASYSFADCFNYCAVGDSSTEVTAIQTGLLNELVRTNSLSPDATAHGAELVGNILTLFRTFAFPPLVSSATYRELGFSPIATAGANLFSRTLFRNSLGLTTDVTVEAGDSLFISYSLSIEIFESSVAINASPTGSPAGVLKFQKIGLKGISTSGLTEDFDDSGACNEPSVVASVFLSSSSSSPDAFGSCVNRGPETATKATTLSTYEVGSRSRQKYADFRPQERPASWRSVGVGSASSHGAILVLDSDLAPHEKLGYVATFTYSWAGEALAGSFYPVYWLDGDDYYRLASSTDKRTALAYFAQ